jgi:SWI/SNF-related matrix-associated actin-dependent regulator of chromatin subfamily A-like protein 1
MPLRPHQETAVDFLLARGFALLWDAPGVGKTPCAVVAAAAICPRRVLVFCPAQVREHWAREFSIWAPSLPCRVEGGFANQVLRDGVTIMSHANLAAHVPCAAIRAGAPFDLIIVDECHEFRRFDAIRCRNLLAAPGTSQFPGIWQSTERLWCLTGTPLVNSSGDLYPLYSGPMRGEASWWDFCSRFAELRPDVSAGYKAVGIRDAPGLAAMLRPHALRRTAESIGLRLPPLDVREAPLALPDGALLRAMSGLEGWDEVRLKVALEANDEVRDPAISRVRHALGLAKAAPAAAHMHGLLAQGEGPLVAFFQHTAVRDALRDALPGLRTGVIDGKTPRARLGEAEAALQQGLLDVLLVQTQAGGIGLSLTRSACAVVVELPWTSTALYQAIARIHRMLQLRPCTADILRATGCWLEDVLSMVVSRKQKASQELLDLLTTSE